MSSNRNKTKEPVKEFSKPGIPNQSTKNGPKNLIRGANKYSTLFKRNNSVNTQVPNNTMSSPVRSKGLLSSTEKSVYISKVNTPRNKNSKTLSNSCATLKTQNISNDRESKPILKCIGTQTEITDNDILSNLVLVTQQQEKEIINLKQTIASLEYCIQSRDAAQSQPVSTLMTTSGGNSNVRFSCYMIGDSQVRGLREKLSPLLPATCSVIGCFQPGAGYHEVAAVHNLSPNLVKPTSEDVVVLVCGTNDVCSTQWGLIESALDDLLRKFYDVKLFCVVGVPRIFSNKKLNFHISRFNSKIKQHVTSNQRNACFLDPNKSLKQKDYATDGIHLNQGGKNKLCRRISNIISNRTSTVVESINPNVPNKPEMINGTIVNDLITLDIADTADETDFASRIQHGGENSTFAHDPSPVNHNMLPVTTPLGPSRSTTLTSQSLLDTPNLPIHIGPLLQSDPNHYMLTNVSMQSFTNMASYSSPLHGIEPIEPVQQSIVIQSNDVSSPDLTPTSSSFNITLCNQSTNHGDLLTESPPHPLLPESPPAQNTRSKKATVGSKTLGNSKN